MLTNLNALTTIGYLQPRNLLMIILDNEQYASTGGQYTFTGRLDLADIAAQCGLQTWKANDRETLQQAMAEAANTPSPCFIRMKIAPGNNRVPLLLEDPVHPGQPLYWLARLHIRNASCRLIPAALKTGAAPCIMGPVSTHRRNPQKRLMKLPPAIMIDSYKLARAKKESPL